MSLAVALMRWNSSDHDGFLCYEDEEGDEGDDGGDGGFLCIAARGEVNSM